MALVGAALQSGEGDACTMTGLTRNSVEGIVVPSPDGASYLVNKEDAKGTGQLYRGSSGSTALTCLTCSQQPGGPKPDRYKTQPTWHPSGRWFFVAAERDTYTTPPLLGWNRDYVEGMIRSGLWTDMYAVSPDGTRWHRLTDFRSDVKGVADGFTGPAFTNDGKKAAWSQVVDGNVLTYTFGRWELILADFQEVNGVPALINRQNITPKGMDWNEVGNFHPDNQLLLLTGSVEKAAQGMDQYLLNIKTNALTNLTNSPKVWDEHGRLSPDGRKIIFMSAHPYRDDPKSSEVLTIKTEFMMMDSNGGNLVQLTHFKTPGYPESNEAIAANPMWHADGRSAFLRTLLFPNYIDWTVSFKNACGAAGPGTAPQRPTGFRRIA
jgi:Tol biopolymer transport system component